MLSFGTAGCNLGCKFCQNWDMSKSKQVQNAGEKAPPELIVKAARESNCRSIAFTYNEPIIWAEYAVETARLARAEGIKTVAVTSGYISPEARDDFFSFMDAANVDLKAFSEDFYRKLTLAHLQPVLDTLCWLKNESSVWFEITNLLIPGENDSPEQIKRMCSWILEHLGPNIPLHFSAFHPDYKMLSYPSTPHETLIKARETAHVLGLNYVYIGNVLDLERQSTYCTNCGEMLIERNHYELTAFRIRDGVCVKCGTEVPGHFENTCGDWGRRRLPLSLADFLDKTMTVDKQKFTEPQQITEVHLRSVEESLTEASEAVEEIALRASSDSCGIEQTPSQDSHSNPKIHFSQPELSELVRFTRDLVEAVVCRRDPLVKLPLSLAQAPAYGVFVTLKRGSLLRGCRGHWGDPEAPTLGALLESSAASTASDDFRFPSITAGELPFLDLEISVMHSPAEIHLVGEERKNEIQVGLHGLVIKHPNGCGLLLPHVATEQNWDRETFLQHLSAKAGLPQDAWKSKNSELMTFETRLILSPAPTKQTELRNLSTSVRSQLFELANILISHQQTQLKASTVLLSVLPELTGIVLKNSAGLTASAFDCNASLAKLTERAAASLLQMSSSRRTAPGPLVQMQLLTEAVLLSPSDYPGRLATISHSAVLARESEKLSLILPEQGVPADKTAHALLSLGASVKTWASRGIELTAFSPIMIASTYQAPAKASTKAPIKTIARQPMCIGSFYPEGSEEIVKELESLFSPFSQEKKKPYRAIMLPHAGWKYCGDIIARTVSQTEVPDLALVIGPKHSPYGARLAAAGEDFWLYPHAALPIAVKLAQILQTRIPGLVRDTEAHRLEHSCEVLLPFLHYANASLRVLPIAIGNTSLSELLSFGEALGNAISTLGVRVLYVISSDLNHFADDDENQRRDRFAIEAMMNGSPEVLYETCKSKDISMCGMQPAVVVMKALLTQSETIAPKLVDYHTSAPISFDYTRVVGYAGMVIE